MEDRDPRTVTRLLLHWREGDGGALEELLPHVYGELRRLARRHMSGERRGHTLQTTALVHEVYARLIDADVSWQDRAHFYAVAARAMRRVLVDHARSKRRVKRGSGAERISLDDASELSFESGERFLDLDLALSKLAGSDSRKAQVVELHYFGGLAYEEIAEVLKVSPSTVGLDLRFAKAWLARELGSGTG